MTSLFSTLYNRYKSTLSANELALLIELSKQTEKIPDSTISQMAELLFISKSSLYRLIRKLGFDGYTTFKYRVTDSLREDKVSHLAPADFFDVTMDQLKKTYVLNQNELEHAARLFLNADTRYVYGTGWKQKQVVDNFSTDLLIYGERSLTLRNKFDLASCVSHMTQNDILVFTSLSGNLKGYENTIDELHIRDIPVISVTRAVPNLLSKEATTSLFFESNPSMDNTEHWPALPMDFIFELFIHTILQVRS